MAAPDPEARGGQTRAIGWSPDDLGHNDQGRRDSKESLSVVSNRSAMDAIDIHHHYVPEQVIEEARRHGKALGVELSEDQDGSFWLSGNGGP